MKLLTFDPRKRKQVLVGEIIGDTLFRNVTTKHFMRVLDGYGIQEDAMRQLVSRGVHKIVIKETDTGKQWESLESDWALHGKSADYGNGKQRFLSLKYMHTHKNALEDHG